MNGRWEGNFASILSRKQAHHGGLPLPSLAMDMREVTPLSTLQPAQEVLEGSGVMFLRSVLQETIETAKLEY